MYPSLITDAYGEEQYRLNLPGSREVNLTRIGAYGIYYENNPVSSNAEQINIPPEIKCSLTSQTTGKIIEAARDYVPGNRYWLKDRSRAAVLVMSVSVDKADRYKFKCGYMDDKTGPHLTVALGPNYIWEFIRVAGKIIFPLFTGMVLVCGSNLIGIILIIVGIIKQRTWKKEMIKY